jgi:hypothetical protein
MLKQRIIKILVGVALLVAAAGGGGIMVDSLGYAGTLPAHACNSSGTSGGGC